MSPFWGIGLVEVLNVKLRSDLSEVVVANEVWIGGRTVIVIVVVTGVRFGLGWDWIGPGLGLGISVEIGIGIERKSGLG